MTHAAPVGRPAAARAPFPFRIARNLTGCPLAPDPVARRDFYRIGFCAA